MKQYRFNRNLLAPAIGILALCLPSINLLAEIRYAEVDIVADQVGKAPVVDPALVNPWGMSFNATSPIWSANNGTGTSTLYSNTGIASAMVVTIRNAAGGVTSPAGSPTGTVFNNFTAAGAPTFNRDNFLFVTEDGTIQGWRSGIPVVAPAPANTAEILVNNSGSSADYKGMAISNVSAATNTIYAADFHNGYILAHPNTGSDFTFADPSIPAGFGPHNVQNLGGKLYVAYARQNATATEDVAGAGNGYVDVFNLDGTLDLTVNGTGRLVSNGALNSPWGLAIAPAAFGPLAGALLVGNFGDGAINAYNLTTGAPLGGLKDLGGHPILLRGLWGIAPGNGGQGTSTSHLYFLSATSRAQIHGLFGKLVPTTVNDTTPPVINSVTASPNTLGEPNGNLVTVTVTVNATDAIDPTPVSSIISVTSNQDPLPSGDVVLDPTNPLKVTLRSANSGGPARIYTLTVECRDSANNASQATVTVTAAPAPGAPRH